MLPSSSVSRGRAIFAFSLGCLFFGYAFVQRVAPSVITDELMREFAVGGAALGSLSAWYFYSYASIQLPVGMLMDRFGPRKLMSFTIGLCALATIGFAMSDSLVMASFSRALIGATVAFGFVGSLTIAGYWFSPSRFATLGGVLQGVGMCGAMLGQAPLRYYVEMFGWRGTMMGLAVIAVLMAVLLFFVIPKRPRANGENHSVQNQGRDGSSGVLNGLKQVCRNIQSWYAALIGFGLTATMLTFTGLWAVPWLSTTMAFSKTQAAGIASLFFLGWGVGSPLAGWISDTIGRRKPVLYAGCLVSMVFFAAIVYSGIEDSVYLGILFFLCGCGGSTMIVCFGVVKEVNLPGNSATSIGLLNMFVVGSGALMQPLVGFLLDSQWSGQLEAGARIYESEAFSNAFGSLMMCQVMALVCIWQLKETFCRQRSA